MSEIFGTIRDLWEDRDVGDIVAGDKLSPLVRIEGAHPQHWIADWLNARINRGEGIVAFDGFRRVMTSDFPIARVQQATLCSKIESLSQGQLIVIRSDKSAY